MGVRKTETSLIIWSMAADAGETGATEDIANSQPAKQPDQPETLDISNGREGSIFGADAFYNAGDQGCGEGPLDKIAAVMQTLQSGQTLEVYATDPTAAIDLPAWCRMTGNILIKHEAARFLIKRQ